MLYFSIMGSFLAVLCRILDMLDGVTQVALSLLVLMHPVTAAISHSVNSRLFIGRPSRYLNYPPETWAAP